MSDRDLRLLHLEGLLAELVPRQNLVRALAILRRAYLLTPTETNPILDRTDMREPSDDYKAEIQARIDTIRRGGLL